MEIKAARLFLSPRPNIDGKKRADLERTVYDMSETFSRPLNAKGANQSYQIDNNRLLRIKDICNYMGVCRTTASKVAHEAGCMVAHGKVYVFESIFFEYLLSKEVPYVS